jgi:hypothetical protein
MMTNNSTTSKNKTTKDLSGRSRAGGADMLNSN